MDSASLSSRSSWAIAHLLRILLGRRLLACIARKLSMEARLDLPNDLASNGERLVQRIAVSAARRGETNTVIDGGGANVGEWTRSLAQFARDAVGLDLRVFAFEPSRQTFEQLSANVRDIGHAITITPIQNALSGVSGTATLHVVDAGAGTNSLH